MSEPRICPNCRTPVPADAPEGVCPACALRAGFDASDPGVRHDATTAEPSGAAAPPPSVEELARRLPELDGFELLGRGGMGAVYRARHRGLDRPVAVKVLDRGLAADPAFAERFTREARTLARLDHPSIVRVHDFGHREGLYYFVMESVDGVNLRQTIRAGGLAPREALAMVPRICEALQYAHDRGIVHRDIKPENILVDRQGAIKIADFGLAKLARDGGADRLTGTEQILGTPHYMAPEQIEHPESVDHRADIFALGVVFYELLTGELPVGRFAPPSKRVEVDVRLDAVVLRTLEKEPSLRYQQASELGGDVESLAGGEAPRARSSESSDPAPRPYEYRSERTVLGLPLLHIAFGRDPRGKRMKVASGIVAIGDLAIGAVAIGGFPFGGIAIGGIGVGLLTFAGIAVGLLTAIGGVGFGGFVVAGFGVGLVTRCVLGIAALSLSEAVLARTTLVAWLLATAGFVAAGAAAIWAWAEATRARPRGR